MKLRLLEYSEEKPHRRKRLFWRVLNAILFPLLSFDKRMRLMRLMGAKTGNDTCYYRSVKVFAPWNLETVNHVMIAENVYIYNKAPVKIGQNVIISRDVFICTASHDVTSPVMKLIAKPIIIGDNVWIGARATLLPGVTIGEGAVVGACAVVSKDLPPWSIAVGNPARVVGRRILKEEAHEEKYDPS